MGKLLGALVHFLRNVKNKKKCLLFFSNEDFSIRKCKYLATDYEQALQCERFRASRLSPKIVGDDEVIVRQIHSPIHIDNGEITSAAFDDVLNKGLSVNRLLYSSEDEIHEQGENKAEYDRQRRPDRKYVGFAKVNAKEIRGIIEDHKRSFAIYDTALEEMYHHADLCSIKLGATEVLSKKAANMERRLKLKKAFSGIVKPN